MYYTCSGFRKLCSTYTSLHNYNWPFRVNTIILVSRKENHKTYLTAVSSFFLPFPLLYILFLPGDTAGGGGGEGDFNSRPVFASELKVHLKLSNMHFSSSCFKQREK